MYKYPYTLITSPPRSSFPLEIFKFSCILQKWGERFCSLKIIIWNNGSDYSLNSHHYISSLDPAQNEKAFKWQVLNTFARQTDTIFLWSLVPFKPSAYSEPQQHDAAWYEMGALEVAEKRLCAVTGGFLNDNHFRIVICWLNQFRKSVSWGYFLFFLGVRQILVVFK